MTRSESLWYILSMDLKQYFYRLTPTERDSFARRAGTTVRYIQCHLLTQRKIPRPGLMRKLVSASGNVVTLDDLLAHFYKTRPADLGPARRRPASV